MEKEENDRELTEGVSRARGRYSRYSRCAEAESEASVESYLAKRCRAEGWITFKFASPGNKGVPDRIVIAEGGKTAFVELKRPKGGRLSPMQRYQIGRLTSIGARVCLLKNKGEVDMFIKNLKEDPE